MQDLQARIVSVKQDTTISGIDFMVGKPYALLWQGSRKSHVLVPGKNGTYTVCVIANSIAKSLFDKPVSEFLVSSYDPQRSTSNLPLGDLTGLLRACRDAEVPIKEQKYDREGQQSLANNIKLLAEQQACERQRQRENVEKYPKPRISAWDREYKL
jgi:hypothetical protein